MKLWWLILSLVISQSTLGQYQSDVLQDGFEYRTFNLNSSSTDSSQATLVRKLADNPIGAFFYVHGYSDYFFQSHMANFIVAQGYNFYAVDLRRYGRSHHLQQPWFEVDSIEEYYPELDSAIAVIQQENNSNIFINGHSTGGLIVSKYVNDRPNLELSGVILNSPFLDFNLDWFSENIGLPIVVSMAKKHPDKTMSQGLDPSYGMSLHVNDSGNWNYNLDWKPYLSPDVTYGWLAAIYNGQKDLRKHASIDEPIVVFCSTESYKKKGFKEGITYKDAVLDVKDMHRLAPKLGDDVTIIEIDKGKHDLSLSIKEARIAYFELMLEWMNAHNKIYYE